MDINNKCRVWVHGVNRVFGTFMEINYRIVR